MALSVVAHLLFLAVYPILTARVVPDAPSELPVDRIPEPEGLRVIALSEFPESPEDADTEPPPAPLPDDPTPTELPEADPDAQEDEDEETGAAIDPSLPSVAERLRPRMADPRLWAPLDAETLALTDLERAELLLRGMIQNWNDSVAVAAALSGRALDWTFTDEDGKRWGLSPGRLHLGEFSIPLPFSFEVAPGRREEWERRQWENEDITRGAATAAIRETWSERAREIRRRMEEERARNREGGDG